MQNSCPNCKLINPAGARLCDCGYDLVDGVQKQRLEPVEESAAHQFRWWFLLAAVVVAVVSGVGGMLFGFLASGGLFLLSAYGFSDRRR